MNHVARLIRVYRELVPDPEWRHELWWDEVGEELAAETVWRIFAIE